MRRTVVSLIPILAQFDQASFVESHLADSMSHMLYQLKKDRDRPSVFVSIGKVSLAIRGNIGPYLDAILQNVKEGLTAKTGKNKPVDGQISCVLECIRMLAAAVVCLMVSC